MQNFTIRITANSLTSVSIGVKRGKAAAVRVQVPEPDYNLNELIMEMYGNTLCVSFTELVRGGIISKPTYDKYVREGKLTLLQRGGNGREALIAYRLSLIHI